MVCFSQWIGWDGLKYTITGFVKGWWLFALRLLEPLPSKDSKEQSLIKANQMAGWRGKNTSLLALSYNSRSCPCSEGNTYRSREDDKVRCLSGRAPSPAWSRPWRVVCPMVAFCPLEYSLPVTVVVPPLGPLLQFPSYLCLIANTDHSNKYGMSLCQRNKTLWKP